MKTIWILLISAIINFLIAFFFTGEWSVKAAIAGWGCLLLVYLRDQNDN